MPDVYDLYVDGDLLLANMSVQNPYRGMRFTVTDASSVTTSYVVRDIEYGLAERMSGSTDPVSLGYGPSHIYLSLQEASTLGSDN